MRLDDRCVVMCVHGRLVAESSRWKSSSWSWGDDGPSTVCASTTSATPPDRGEGQRTRTRRLLIRGVTCSSESRPGTRAGCCPYALAAAEMLVVGLLDPAPEVADRLGVRDSLEEAEECDNGDCDYEDNHEASP